jgi:hypothetical protein
MFQMASLGFDPGVAEWTQSGDGLLISFSPDDIE